MCDILLCHYFAAVSEFCRIPVKWPIPVPGTDLCLLICINLMDTPPTPTVLISDPAERGPVPLAVI